MSLNSLSKENLNYLINELKKDNSWVLYQTGDILKRPDINILIHQANCFCIMNAGIAYKIKECYPAVSLADKKTKPGDKEKLGSFTSTLEKNINTGKELIILNLYSQYNPGRCEEFSAGIDSKEKRLFYLKECLMSLADFISLYHMESDPEQIIIGVPWMIGCGIAGNDINATFELFKTIFEPLKKHVKIMFVDFN